MVTLIKEIVSNIKNFIHDLWRGCVSFFGSLFGVSQPLTDDEKYSFIIALLNGQDLSTGFALRHVSSDETYYSNLQNGFWGDAVSYSITKHIMSVALNEEVRGCVWIRDARNEYYFSINDEIQPTFLDKILAIRIFDVIHSKILQFIGLNYDDNQPHHFMIVKDMQAAVTPYDIKDIYPTGKCGKREVTARQIAKSISKSASLDTAESMLNKIEKEVIELYKPAKYAYTEQDTRAILSVLREINVNANDKSLVSDDVSKRLIEAEYEHRWSDATYQSFHETGGSGFFGMFKKLLPQINEDLEYFKHRL